MEPRIWIGYIGVEKINGSFFNVMGLPVHLVYEELGKFIEYIHTNKSTIA